MRCQPLVKNVWGRGAWVYGLSGSVYSVGAPGDKLIPVGYALAGILSDRFNPIGVFVIASALKIITGLIGLSLRAVRELR